MWQNRNFFGVGRNKGCHHNLILSKRKIFTQVILGSQKAIVLAILGISGRIEKLSCFENK